MAGHGHTESACVNPDAVEFLRLGESWTLSLLVIVLVLVIVIEGRQIEHEHDYEEKDGYPLLCNVPRDAR